MAVYALEWCYQELRKSGRRSYKPFVNLITTYNNLSAQLISAYLEASPVSLVDSDFSLYFKHIVQHSLELDLFLDGNSHLISLYNLPSQLIAAYLEDSPVSLVDSEYNTYIDYNSQHRSE